MQIVARALVLLPELRGLVAPLDPHGVACFRFRDPRVAGPAVAMGPLQESVPRTRRSLRALDDPFRRAVLGTDPHVPCPESPTTGL